MSSVQISWLNEWNSVLKYHIWGIILAKSGSKCDVKHDYFHHCITVVMSHFCFNTFKSILPGEKENQRIGLLHIPQESDHTVASSVLKKNRSLE